MRYSCRWPKRAGNKDCIALFSNEEPAVMVVEADFDTSVGGSYLEWRGIATSKTGSLELCRLHFPAESQRDARWTDAASH